LGKLFLHKKWPFVFFSNLQKDPGFKYKPYAGLAVKTSPPAICIGFKIAIFAPYEQG